MKNYQSTFSQTIAGQSVSGWSTNLHLALSYWVPVYQKDNTYCLKTFFSLAGKPAKRGFPDLWSQKKKDENQFSLLVGFTRPVCLRHLSTGNPPLTRGYPS